MRKKYNSLIFSNYFIKPVWGTVDKKSIPETLGMRQEYIMDGAPVHWRAECTLG